MSLRFSDSARVERSERQASHWARSGDPVHLFLHFPLGAPSESAYTAKKRFAELVSNAYVSDYV